VTRALRSQPPELSAIQSSVRHELDRVGDEIKRIVLSDFSNIEEVNEHLLFMRGKLFRPTLLLLASRVEGESHDDALTMAAVVELVHLATLVHDDAVDHSALRRGLPTVNALWTHQVAIIMGDYLYSRGVAELARVGRLQALAVLANAANEMSVGEMRQLTSYDALDFSEEDYYRLIAAKTASLMAAACELGALTGAPAYRQPLRTFGRELGLAFQIADDLLDYTADSAVTGKPTGLDLREHKVTLPLIAVLPRLSDTERARVNALFADPEPDDEMIAGVVEIVRLRGGLEYAREAALECAQRAAEALEGLPEGPALDALRDSIVYAVERRR
jgi:octaprenyl-diphosphate synthase